MPYTPWEVKPYKPLKKNEEKTLDKVAKALKQALGLSNRHPIWRAMISRSQPGVCEVRILDQKDRICDLKQNARFLTCDEKGQISTVPDVSRPSAGAQLIVIPASCKSNARIAFWGFREELMDVSEQQTAIGSGGNAHKKSLEVVPDCRTSRRLNQTLPRRDPRAMKKLLKRTA